MGAPSVLANSYETAPSTTVMATTATTTVAPTTAAPVTTTAALAQDVTNAPQPAYDQVSFV